MKKKVKIAIDAFLKGQQVALYNGDCLELLKNLPDGSVDLIITSPPYCMKKAYENLSDDLTTFEENHKRIIADIYRVLKVGGSVCWQTGYHVSKTIAIPLDYHIYQIFSEHTKGLEIPFVLRNRIIWTFGHGMNSTQRFSGRHETILWFTKGYEYKFNLDEVRVPQKYPGKRAYKGSKQGQLSGNPLGKNPSDVWDIPNVKAHHLEKTEHPCQFPVVLPQRLIRALTKQGDVIFDPFMGSGTTGIAAIIEGRRFIGSETQKKYYKLSIERIGQAQDGTIRYREDKPVYEPNQNTAVARLPEEFRMAREAKDEKSKKTKDDD